MENTSFKDWVVQTMKTLYPEELADKEWDNTGLLVDVALPGGVPNEKRKTVLLTNDLTAAVVKEAIQIKASIIVCYHPVIFRPLKSLTHKDPLQSLLMQLIASQIAVYCPHTAVDAAPGGLNDWLCDIIMGNDGQKSRKTMKPITRPLALAIAKENPGYGKEVVLSTPKSLNTLIQTLSAGLGNLRHIFVVEPDDLSGVELAEMSKNIDHIAVCVGSGSSVVRGTDAQLIVTGEMSHHEALDFARRGQFVLSVFHSNSERQFLTQRMKPQLETKMKADGIDGIVVVSQKDKDPFRVVDVTSMA